MKTPILTCSLNSGSNGNCIYVEKGDTRLLFDAGISGKKAATRLADHGRDIGEATALVVSHNHADHAAMAGVYQRKFGVPIYVTQPTFEWIEPHIGKTSDVRHFEAGDVLTIGALQIETIPTPHDGVDGVIFVVTDGRRRLGIFTDLGHPFPELGAALADIDLLYMESNYDPDLLRTGGYPPHLKARIRGRGGHLSNRESALVVRDHCSDRLQTLVLAHLSESNNEPEIALETHRHVSGCGAEIHVASRYGPSSMFTIE